MVLGPHEFDAQHPTPPPQPLFPPPLPLSLSSSCCRVSSLPALCPMRVRPTQQRDRPPAPTSSLIFSVSTSITASRAVMSLRQRTHRRTRVCAGVCMTSMRRAACTKEQDFPAPFHLTVVMGTVSNGPRPPTQAPLVPQQLDGCWHCACCAGCQGRSTPHRSSSAHTTAPLTWLQSHGPVGTCRSVRGWGCHALRWPSAWWTYHIRWSPAARSACEPHPHHR